MQRLLIAALVVCATALIAACGGTSTSKPATQTATVIGSTAQAIAPPIPPTPALPNASTTPGKPAVGPTAVRIDAAPGTRLPNPAPIRDASVQTLESSPPKYVLHVTAGLLGVCAQPGSQEVVREGTTFRVTVTNLLAPNLTCQVPETTYDLNITLTGDFTSSTQYTVNVNSKIVTFTAR